MTYKGVYRDGIVILHGDVDLQNGAPVEVNPAPRRSSRTAKTTAPKRRSGATKKSSKKSDHPLPGFGSWKHRSDITDSARFARELRGRVSRRGPRD
jgi:hypothetical protein